VATKAVPLNDTELSSHEATNTSNFAFLGVPATPVDLKADSELIKASNRQADRAKLSEIPNKTLTGTPLDSSSAGVISYF
jgi:hypothetical protein